MSAPTLHAAHRTSTVLAADGTPLAVHEYGGRSADLTVVFVHGHCLRSAAWHYQLAQLRRRWGSRVRLLAYDQRGHGGSGQASMDTYTVDQLGRDLGVVLRAAHADNVILVGHSMGGMAALSYVRQHPADAARRLKGLALIATAGHGLAEHGIGRSLSSPLLGLARILVSRTPSAAATVRMVGQHLCRPLIHGFGYGRHTSPRLRTLGTAMLNEVPLATMVGYLAGLSRHDERAALPLLHAIPVEVVCGSADLMTPPVHSHALAAALPAAALTLIDGAGHMLIHEHPTQVSEILSTLIAAAHTTRPAPEAELIAHA